MLPTPGLQRLEEGNVIGEAACRSSCHIEKTSDLWARDIIILRQRSKGESHLLPGLLIGPNQPESEDMGANQLIIPHRSAFWGKEGGKELREKEQM